MKYPKCFGSMMLVLGFILLGPVILSAQEARPVYLVRQIGQNDVWTMNMGIQTEALRLYVPTSFERKGKAVNLGFDTPRVSLRSGRESVISRSADGILVRYDVFMEGAPRLPKADRSMTIRFSLAELGAAEAVDADSPGFYAIRQAVLTGPYTKGLAWVQSIDFKDDHFVVVVALKR